MDLAGILNYFNVIDAIDGVRGDLFSLLRKRGGGVGIAFAAPSGVAGQGVEDTLARYEIPACGRRVTGHHDLANGEKWLTFSLRTEANRADWARYIIWRKGCIVLNDPNPDNALWAARHTDLPPAWADRAEATGEEKHRTQPTAPQGKRGGQALGSGRIARAARDLW